MKHIFLIMAAAAVTATAGAKGLSPVGLDSIRFDRHGDFMVLDMNLDLKPTDVSRGRAQVLTPLIVSAQGDTVTLKPVGVYGRQRYLQYLRNGQHPLGGADESIIKSSDRKEPVDYHSDVAYADWMSDSRLLMRRSLYGCANCLIEEDITPVGSYFEPDPEIPEIVYFEVDKNATDRITEYLEGQAFVDFPVDQTVIYPEYRNNVRELGKIQASIDTVLNDRDVTITEVWLKGFASPESPYSHNTDLAKGRVAALKKHISQLYSFGGDIITTDYEPEDWGNLRIAVEKSNIGHKAEILALIDSDMAPDPKEARIKSLYPAEYRFMLQNFYPALRHTDYKISYEINRFDDLDKIREVMRTRPSRLTLREFFLLGNAAQKGSDEFNEVYETAARIYPDNATANINAANAALQRKDYVSAARYLERAGDSEEADYARGSLAFLEGDLDKAEQYMKKAPSIVGSKATLDEIAKIRSKKNEGTSPDKTTLK